MRNSFLKRARGFTLIELLVVVAIIALLISILLPSLSRARELSRRTACGANVKAIATACLIYSEGNAGVFPTPNHIQATTAGADLGAAQKSATYIGHKRWAPDMWASSTATGTVANNGSNTRGYFKLLQGGERAYLQAKQWICPSGRTVNHKPQGTTVEAPDPQAGNAVRKTYDFSSALTDGAVDNIKAELTEFSYSMQVTLRYRDSTLGEVLGTVLTNTQDPRKAIGADRNPYSNTVRTGITNAYDFTAGKNVYGFPAPPTKTGTDADYIRALKSKEANSRNHNRDGQNVAYLDGHATFQKNSKSGADEDCIWLKQADTTNDGIPDGDEGSATNIAGTKYGEMRSRAHWLTDSILIP